jgi:predicted extracellular nuclease
MKIDRLLILPAVFILLSFVVSPSAPGSLTALAAAPTELFFSEYIEGSSNNKALEIFNGTGSTIDLAAGAYDVQMFFNGNSSPLVTISLTGSVASGDVYVLAHASATAAILNQADQTSTVNWYNGNDAVVLRKNNVIIDVIGQIGFDPGTEWGTGLTSTSNNTLQRKCNISQGDPNGLDAFDPATEWDGFAQDTFTGLGSHSGCQPPSFRINELDADQTGTDSAEFIELYDGGGGNASLDGHVLVLYNGNGDVSYAAFDLDGYSTDANGYFVLCGNSANTPNCGMDAAPDTDLIQNGADGAALYTGDAASFPTGTPVTTTNLLDAIVYDTDDADDVGLLVLLNPGEPQVNENSKGNAIVVSSQRCPNGSGGARNTSTFDQFPPTPGSDNVCSVPFVCGNPATLIHDIQGSGATSPLVSQQHQIEGVVVGDFQDTTNGLGGFFLQEESGDFDGNSQTSEGIFVYDNGFGVDVSVGQSVRVKGSVAEYYELTELSGITNLAICGTGMTTPATISLPVSSLSDWEAVEGMDVSIPQILFVTDNFTLGRYGEVELSVNKRLFTPTAIIPPGPPALAQQDLNNRSRIQLDDGSTVQNPVPLPPYLGADNTLRVGDTIAGLTGVLSYGFGAYEIHPIQAVAFTRLNNRPPIPTAVPEVLKVAGMNVLNYFTTLDTGAAICGPSGNLGCRGANTAQEFSRQLSKIINTIVTMDADILGLTEIENNATTAIQDLVDGLNSMAGAGTYAFINTGTIGSDAIKVALIYKPAKVSPVGAFAILDSSVDPNFLDSKNRPSLAQTFQDPAGRRLTVVVNHFKSKGSACDDVFDPDAGDGQGNCNLTRKAAAQALADWLESDPTMSGDPDFLIVGDLNSYAMEDPITVLVSEGYTSLVSSFSGSNAYSYVFDGQSGTLDYALASSSLATQVAGTTEWHINADEPSALDYNDYNQPALYTSDPYRSADHDPIMVSISPWQVTQIGNELRIMYTQGSTAPQVAVLHLNDSYFRMNYGPASGWGTSLVLLPAFWSNGTYYHGAPVTAAYQVVGENLELELHGSIGGLQVSLSVTLLPPAGSSLTARVQATAQGNVSIDVKPGEAFKPVFLSSMHISSTQWDTPAAYTGCQSWSIPGSGWLIPPTPPVISQVFGFLGGTSLWKTNAPGMQIVLDQPRQVAGWVTLSSDPNDDNLGLWAASDTLLPAWSYTVTASNAEQLNCMFIPLLFR